MPHVTSSEHKMEKTRKGTQGKKKKSRDRSDLSIAEFGAKSRNKDVSLSGHRLSPHWNEKGKV